MLIWAVLGGTVVGIAGTLAAIWFLLRWIDKYDTLRSES